MRNQTNTANVCHTKQCHYFTLRSKRLSCIEMHSVIADNCTKIQGCGLGFDVSVWRCTNVSSRSISVSGGWRLGLVSCPRRYFWPNYATHCHINKWAKSVVASYGSVNPNRLMHYLLTDDGSCRLMASLFWRVYSIARDCDRILDVIRFGYDNYEIDASKKNFSAKCCIFTSAIIITCRPILTSR